MNRKELLADVKKVVIKVGTSSLTHENGLLNIDKIEKLVRAVAHVQNTGYEVVLVSSGAIGAGLGRLKLSERPSTIPEKQAVAAVGQVALIHLYQKLFFEYGKNIGQLLLTRGDFADRRRFLNGRNACFELIRKGVIPIINENDAVATEEIKVGDNDTLSALVATLIDADLLIILSDIEGLYTADPRRDPEATLIPLVTEIDAGIKKMAAGAGSKLGTGGMATKISAAEIATSKGVKMLIANGEDPHILVDIMEGLQAGTLFIPRAHPVSARKHWIKYGSTRAGTLILDSGACRAIGQGKSLLPGGITEVKGKFLKGDIVSICTPEGSEVAAGIVNYSSKEVELIKGAKTSEIEGILGHQEYKEVVHSNNMFRN